MRFLASSNESGIEYRELELLEAMLKLMNSYLWKLSGDSASYLAKCLDDLLTSPRVPKGRSSPGFWGWEACLRLGPLE